MIGDYAIQKQQQVDTAEANRLSLGYKENVASTFEQMKDQYANEPEKLGPAFYQSMQDHLSNVTQQSSNPRVNLMVGRGDPQFDGLMVRQAQSWQFQQREQVDKASVLTGADKAVEDAGALVTKDGQTYDNLKQEMLPIFSRLGNLTAGAFALAHPAIAQKFGEDTQKSAYMNIVGKMIDHNPIWAEAFLQEPETKKLIGGEPMYERMQKAALEQVKNFQQNQEFNESISLMAKNPELMQQVNDGSKTWSDLVKMDPGHTNPMISLMEKNLLNNSPAAREEQQGMQLDIMEQARQLGIGPKLTATNRVNQLVDFHTRLLQAQPFMSPKDFTRINTQLNGPLTAAVIAAHKPAFWEDIKNQTGGFWGKITNDPKSANDNWAGGYDTINNYLKNSGLTKDSPGYTENKLKLLTDYIDNTHKLSNSNFMDSSGQKYTPETLAYDAIGQNFKVGGMWPTPVGMRQISGFKAPGNPTFKFSDEDITRYNLMKKKAK